MRTEGNDLIVFSLFTQSATVNPATGFATPRPRSAERPVATRLLGALPLTTSAMGCEPTTTDALPM